MRLSAIVPATDEPPTFAQCVIAHENGLGIDDASPATGRLLAPDAVHYLVGVTAVTVGIANHLVRGRG
jgi:hypothetical protein